MSRFEQRKDFGPAEMLAARGVKIDPKNAVVHLENTGNESDLLRQQNIYWREGYDKFHGDESGIYMQLPREEVDANVRRYQKESNERLMRPSGAGLDKEFREEGNVTELESPVSAQDFLEHEE